MLLIERHWAGRTQPLREGFARAARAAGLRLHDHNRKGEKGFFRERLPELKLRASQESDLSDLVEPFGVKPLDLSTAVALHLRTLTLGLEALSEALPI